VGGWIMGYNRRDDIDTFDSCITLDMLQSGAVSCSVL
jgi:hypothetical protein